MKKKVKKI